MTGLNQHQIRKLRKSTLTSIKATTGRDGLLCFCDEQDTLYRYLEAGSAYTANDQNVLTTGNGGNTRWLGLAGQYALYGSTNWIRTGTVLYPVNANDSVDIGSGNYLSTGYIGRDSDNNIDFSTDDQLNLTIGGVTTGVVSISTGTADNDKLVTQGYVDDNAGSGIYYQNVVQVDPSGNLDYTSIASAIASITTAGPTNRFKVEVGPGIYVEPPMTGKEYVDVMSITGPMQTMIVASTPGSALITFAGTGMFSGFTLTGTSGAPLMLMASTGKTQLIDNVMVFNATIGLSVTAGYVLGNSMNAIAYPTTSIGKMVSLTSTGSATIKALGSAEGAAVTTAISAIGSSVKLTVHGARLTATSTTAIDIDDAIVDLVDTTIKNATIGVQLDGSCVLSADTLYMDDSVTYHANILSANVTLKLAGGEIDRNRVIPAAGFQGETAQFIDSSDKVMLTWAEMSVGRPMHPRQMSVGDGKEYSSGMKVYTTDNTASSTSDGGNLTDVTAAATSPSGSTFSFQGVTANHTIIIGTLFGTTTDMLKISSLVMHQVAAAVEVTTKSFALELWDGSNWYETSTFAVDNVNLYRYSNNIFQRANSEENIFFTPSDDWTKKTIDSQTLYWLRVRIKTTITTAPTFQQLHVQHNFSRFTIKGQQFFVGEGKFKTSLTGGGNIFGESGGVGSGNFPVGSGGLPTGWNHYVKNCVLGGNGDAIYFQGNIPRGFCTACPIQVRATIMGIRNVSSSDATFIISLIPVEKSGVLVADPAGGIEPVPRTLANTETLTSKAGQYSSTDVEAGTAAYRKYQLMASGYFSIADYYEGDVINVRIEMDDDGSGNQNFVVWAVEVVGAKWTHGERVPS